MQFKWRPEAGLTVVLAAKGYPGEFPRGSVIKGLESVTGAKVGGGCSGLQGLVRGVPWRLCHPGLESVTGAKWIGGGMVG